jgi:hypothetical protein
VDEPWIAPSAIRHGISVEDILHAWRLADFWAAEPDDEGLVMVVAPTRTGALLELGIIDTADGPVIVHALPARPNHLR